MMFIWWQTQNLFQIECKEGNSIENKCWSHLIFIVPQIECVIIIVNQLSKKTEISSFSIGVCKIITQLIGCHPIQFTTFKSKQIKYLPPPLSHGSVKLKKKSGKHTLQFLLCHFNFKCVMNMVNFNFRFECEKCSTCIDKRDITWMNLSHRNLQTTQSTTKSDKYGSLKRR